MSCLSTTLSALSSYLCLALYSSQCPPLIPLPGSPLLSVSSPHTSAWLSTPLRVLPSYLCLVLHSTVVLIIGNNHCFNDMYTEKSPSQLSACGRHASMFVPIQVHAVCYLYISENTMPSKQLFMLLLSNVSSRFC